MKINPNYPKQERSQGNESGANIPLTKNRELMDRLFRPTFAEEYELAIKMGDARFGSECRHEETKDGVCMKCLRRVVV